LDYSKIVLNMLAYPFFFCIFVLLPICDDGVLHGSRWHYRGACGRSSAFSRLCQKEIHFEKLIYDFFVNMF